MDNTQINAFLEEFLSSLLHLQIREESIQMIRNQVNIIRVKSKDTLILPKEICKHVYIVVEGGFVCRYIHGQNGTAKAINFYLSDLHPIMACLDSYFTQTPSNCELRAVTNSVVLALPKNIADALRESDPFFTKYYYDIFITAIVEENDLKMKLIAYSAKEKYDYILQEMPSVVQLVPSKYIAEFCGISAEWLSKLKKQR